MMEPVECPYCHRRCPVHFDAERSYLPVLVQCDPDEGGCGFHFVASINIAVSITVYSLTTRKEVAPHV